MNHTAHVIAEATLPYRNRSYVLHLIDERHFEALNQTPVYRDVHGTLHEAAPAPVQALNGYCLDALDESPAGSMQATCEKNPQPWRRGGRQTCTERGSTLAELQERATLLELLINEILTEDASGTGIKPANE